MLEGKQKRKAAISSLLIVFCWSLNQMSALIKQRGKNVFFISSYIVYAKVQIFTLLTSTAQGQKFLFHLRF